MPKEKRPRICAVRGCPGDRDLTKSNARLNPLPGEAHLSFFRVPAIISRYNSKYCGKKGTGVKLEKMIELSTTRRNAWLKAIRKENEPEDKCIKTCARHFISGRPADLEDETNPDWVPTLKLVPEVNPLGKAKFVIKQLVQKQINTSFRLKYGLGYEDEKEELKEEKNEPIGLHGDSSSSILLSEAAGMEEVLIRAEPKNASRAKKRKEVLTQEGPKKESRAKKRKEVLIQEEPNNEPGAKKKKEVLIREEPKNESRAKQKKEVLIQEESKNDSKLEDAPSVELSIEKEDNGLEKGKIFLDNEATNSNITNYMLKHSDEQDGHWHLRFCKNKNCTLNEENDCEITNGMQAQPSEQKGHYHLRLCTCKSCVLSQSVDKMYSLEGKSPVKMNEQQ